MPGRSSRDRSDPGPVFVAEIGDVHRFRPQGVYISRGTFPKALTLLSEYPERFAPIVTDRIALADWTTAAELLLRGAAAGKIMVTP